MTISTPRPRRSAILVLTPDSKPNAGGIAEYLHHLSLALAAHYPVRVVTSVPGAEEFGRGLPFDYDEVAWSREQMSMAGDGFWLLDAVNTLRWRAQRRGRAVQCLSRLLHEQPARMVLIGRLAWASRPWCSACRHLGIEYSVVAHGAELLEWRHPLQRHLWLRDLFGATRIYANSSATKDLLLRMGMPGERIAMLIPGVSPEGIPEPDRESRRRMREALGLRDRRFMLSLCRLVKRKGIDFAIEAFASIAPEFPDVDLVVAGSGPEERPLRRLVERLGLIGRIHFPGAVDEHTKSALFAECEFFVMPNRRLPHDVEGFGIVFLEAGLFGKAVVGGRNGGVVDAVEDGVTGVLVDTAEGIAPLSIAMRGLLTDPDRANAMGRHGRARALDDFRWDRRMGELLKDAARAVPQEISR